MANVSWDVHQGDFFLFLYYSYAREQIWPNHNYFTTRSIHFTNSKILYILQNRTDSNIHNDSYLHLRTYFPCRCIHGKPWKVEPHVIMSTPGSPQAELVLHSWHISCGSREAVRWVDPWKVRVIHGLKVRVFFFFLWCLINETWFRNG